MPKTTRPNLTVTTITKTKAISKSTVSTQKTKNHCTFIKSDKRVEITNEILERLSSFHKETCARQNLDDNDTFKYAGAIDDDGKRSPKTPATAASVSPSFKVESAETAASMGLVKRRSFPQGKIILDGATGSELDRRGADCSLPLWSANANLTAPHILKDVHKHYLRNGCQAITTNTFRTNENMMNKVGLGHLSKQLTVTAVQMAVEARDEVNPDALVLGCVAPVESCYRADLAPDTETCKKEHRKMFTNLLDAGVDMLLLETCCSAHEAVVAAEVAQEMAPGHWAISFSLENTGTGILRCGTPIANIVHKLKDAAFIGINCIDGKDMLNQVKHLKSIVPEGVRIAAYGNIGYWVPPAEYKSGVKKNNEVVHDAMYAKFVKEWIKAGAEIVGGCCGTTPDTMRMLHAII